MGIVNFHSLPSSLGRPSSAIPCQGLSLFGPCQGPSVGQRSSSSVGPEWHQGGCPLGRSGWHRSWVRGSSMKDLRDVKSCRAALGMLGTLEVVVCSVCFAYLCVAFGNLSSALGVVFASSWHSQARLSNLDGFAMFCIICLNGCDSKFLGDVSCW